MLFNDLLHDGEPQTGPLRLACDIGVKDPPEQLSLKSGTIVTHGDHRVRRIATGFEAAGDFEGGRRNPIERLEGVRDQIVEDLPDAPAIGLNPLDVVVEVQPDRGTRIL